MQIPTIKIAILIWLAIYPTINLLFWLSGTSLNGMAMYLRTLLLTNILGPSMVFVLLPFSLNFLQNGSQNKTKKYVDDNFDNRTSTFCSFLHKV